MTETDAPADGEHAVIDALERLGLSNYEARVFVALQRLGTGTAKEIHELAGVPRSQVYGTAESLEAQGLVERQQGTPKRYRPVTLDAARERLESRLEQAGDQAFSYLETIDQDRTGTETKEDVWTVRGRSTVDDRCLELVESADDALLFAAAVPELASVRLVEALSDRAADGIEVTVVSEHPGVRAQFADEPVAVYAAPDDHYGEFSGRVVLVDDRAILLSVVPPDASVDDETAIWSAGTGMATILVQVTKSGIEALVSKK
ncbi:TrmB family transcriptional regulator [Haloferacaceae archaeon DSL9]